MNEDTVRKWILKAESDLKIAKDELITQDPATDAICFHAQQVVEKYLKAFLIFNNREIKKSHNIAEIIKQCTEIDPEFNQLLDWGADELTDYAVSVRYGGDFYFPSEKEASEAVELAEKIKRFVLNKLSGSGFKFSK